MTFRLVFKKVVVGLCVVSLLSFGSTVNGATKKSKVNNTTSRNVQDSSSAGQFSLKDMQKIGNGVNITVNPNDNGDSANIDVNSNKLKKGYYWSSIYKVVSEDWSNYGIVAFNVNNKSKGDLALNFVIQLGDRTSVNVSNNQVIMLKSENSSVVQRIRTSSGAFKIPEKFKGTVYIPFNSLGKQGADSQDKQYNVSNILSWGLVTSMEQNQDQNFEISKLSLINKDDQLVQDAKMNFVLTGDSDVQIPVMGESIADYKIQSNDSSLGTDKKNVKYKLETPVKGISINSNGRLTILPNVKVQNVKVLVFVKDNLCEVKSVRLFKSWTVLVKLPDDKKKSVPTLDSVPNLISGGYKFFLNENTILAIRIIFVLLVVGFGGFFIWWRKKYING